MSRAPEISELLSLSARVGRNPFLVQASSGNTSLKLGSTLWIKASGKWLAHAEVEEILVPVELRGERARARPGVWVNGNYLEPSIETAMHAILPDRVVMHVHSVNAISWAVRTDGPQRLAERLKGILWCWIPYVASGLPLAKAIERAAHDQPGTAVFVLANHGLVICGRSCEAVERLLGEVEQRLTTIPRGNEDTESGVLLPLDSVSERVLGGGILYPCQVIFLAAAYVIIEGQGVMTNARITLSQRAVLDGLLKVARRVEADATLRYLSGNEISAVLNEDAHRYQLCTEKNAMTNGLSAPR